MALSGINFDDISERDLVDQKDAGVPEGIMVDYKRDLYGRSDADVREFLKDISSFANTAGGHLIIGIDETGGIPNAICPLNGDADQELQRLENLARDGLEPRISGLRMRAVRLGAGGFAIVVRIPKSFNPPHRVSTRNTNRIYGRNSAGAYEFSMDELRVVFSSGATTLDRTRAFRADRLARIEAGEAIVQLVNDTGRLVLHIAPLSAFASASPIDPERAHANQQLFRPLSSMGFSGQINFDGFATVHSSGGGLSHAYTQVFRNGIVEAVKVRAVSQQTGAPTIPVTAIEGTIVEALPDFISGLQRIDVAPPVILMITLLGVGGARLAVPNDHFDPTPILKRTRLELPEIWLDRYGPAADYDQALRPAFDALWNSGGYAKSMNYDKSGRWAPDWRRRK